MSVDKALYSGVPQLNTVEPDIEIEVENPEAMHIGIGGLEIDMFPEKENDFDANLAEQMTEGELQSLAGELMELVDGRT